MELGLSLGDVSEPLRFLKKNDQQRKPTSKNSVSLDFCMDLGLKSPVVVGNQEREKSQKSQENEEDDEDDDDDDDGGDESDDDDDKPLQLSLVPFVPRQISSHLHQSQLMVPWSSDNGSSENGSSGNMGMAARMGLDVNRPAAVAEEVSSSANRVGSPFHLEFNMYRSTPTGNMQLRGTKRSSELEGAGNDGAEAERTSSPRGVSDDDENALNARKKLRLSKEQSAYLEESFKEHNTLNPKQKLALAKQLNLRPRQVEVWFQNRRARTKLKQTEVDCEYLKRCCETLTDENRRLHKELQELRSLKTSSNNNPFFMQLPATTLTMCPSCERVSTSTTIAAPTPPATATAAADSTIPKAIPFPLTTRPRFYPFSQSPTCGHNQPAAS